MKIRTGYSMEPLCNFTQLHSGATCDSKSTTEVIFFRQTKTCLFNVDNFTTSGHHNKIYYFSPLPLALQATQIPRVQPCMSPSSRGNDSSIFTRPARLVPPSCARFRADRHAPSLLASATSCAPFAHTHQERVCAINNRQLTD